MAETPLTQEELADATYETVELTWLPLAGEETETLANDKVAELSASKRANFLIKRCSCREEIKTSTGFCGWITRSLRNSNAPHKDHFEERLLKGCRPEDYEPKFSLIA